MAPPPHARRAALRHAGANAEASEELVAVEEPLEIRVAGQTLAVTMRTPGDDAALALGFLFAEGVLGSMAEVLRVHVCQEGRGGEATNVVDVLPAAAGTLPVEALLPSRRGTLTTSACGVCGRRSVEDLLARLSPLASSLRLPRALLASAPERLARHQPVFERTGAVHGAALLDRRGAVLAAAEDVGRHNAVDRVVGALFAEGRLPSEEPAVLAVSGRVSFEIVQKAAAARVPFVVAVSAPTSLAVDVAEAMGVTLCAFARADRFTAYAGAGRIG
jgi:FdhD protein